MFDYQYLIANFLLPVLNYKTSVMKT